MRELHEIAEDNAIRRDAARAMLAALKEIDAFYFGEEGFDQAVRDGIDAELIQVRAAIIEAEAAGIKAKG